MRELKAALKSRPMRRLKHLQKQKYDTSLLLSGVYGVRMKHGNRTGTTLELLGWSLQMMILDCTNDEDDDTIFKKGEFVAFRSTDGLPLNILQLTKGYQQDSATPQIRIKGNFLTSEDHRHQEIVLFMSDPQLKHEYMLFAHVLRDMDDKMVVLREIVKFYFQ